MKCIRANFSQGGQGYRPVQQKKKISVALFAGNTRIGFVLLLALVHLFPSLIQRDDELIDDLQQSARIGLNGCEGAKLLPVFFVDGHVMTKARTWPNRQATSVDEEATEIADDKRVAAGL